MASPGSGWTSVWRRRLQIAFVVLLLACAIAVWYLVISTSRGVGVGA